MTARTTVQSLSGAIVSISATLPATYDAAGYGATSVVYTPVGEVEDFGSHGMTATISEFTPVATGIVAKVKGSKNYGMKSLVLADLPGNAGQVLLETAAESTAHYSVKIAYPAGDGEVTGAIHYMDVLVAKKENQDGDVNNVRRLAVDLAICRKPVVVAAT
jgi:hypothetical protein